MARNALWFVTGGITALVVVIAIGVAALDALLPWDGICAALAPMQHLVEAGSKLIPSLQHWLTQAQELLSQRPTAASEEARSGLAGLLDQATDVGVGLARTALDLLTAPLQALIALAKETLGAVQEAVDAAQRAIAAADAAQCG